MAYERLKFQVKERESQSKDHSYHKRIDYEKKRLFREFKKGEDKQRSFSMVKIMSS